MLTLNYKVLEDKFISKKDRFKLTTQNINELKKDFLYSNILITGAAGSIGSHFVQRLNIFNFDKLFLLDKDENQLTELNRELLLQFNSKKINKTFFICSDINFLNLQNFITKNKITHYLNFAAIKHVRSEEQLDSIKYMFSTNSENFIINKKLSKKNTLKKVFSVSTDKSVNPKSLLGISKKVMEQRLAEFKNKNKNVFVSTVRFANVSFSNGSVLKYIVDRINNNKIFGIPDNIYRFFITHNEASSLCLKSLLKENDNNIVIPNKTILTKLISIKSLCTKILNYYGYNPLYVKKNVNKKNKNDYIVILNKHRTHGQKDFEVLYEDNDKLIIDKKDLTINKISFHNFMKSNLMLKDIYKIKTLQSLPIAIKKFFPKYKMNKNVKSLSRII